MTNQILENILIDKEKFKKIYSFVDFGNVNHWYDRDKKDWNGNMLDNDQKIIVDIERLANFIDLFSERKRFYYGLDIKKKSTWHITNLAKRNKFFVAKKPIQWIKHYLDSNNETLKEIKINHRIKRDKSGLYILIPKCNFDVELTLHVRNLINYYDTLALFSGDSDFGMLLKFLRNQNKKIILFYAGHISCRIKDYADLAVNAQNIKNYICSIKQTKKNPV